MTFDSFDELTAYIDRKYDENSNEYSFVRNIATDNDVMEGHKTYAYHAVMFLVKTAYEIGKEEAGGDNSQWYVKDENGDKVHLGDLFLDFRGGYRTATGFGWHRGEIIWGFPNSVYGNNITLPHIKDWQDLKRQLGYMLPPGDDEIIDNFSNMIVREAQRIAREQSAIDHKEQE